MSLKYRHVDIYQKKTTHEYRINFTFNFYFYIIAVTFKTNTLVEYRFGNLSSHNLLSQLFNQSIRWKDLSDLAGKERDSSCLCFKHIRFG